MTDAATAYLASAPGLTERNLTQINTMARALEICVRSLSMLAEVVDGNDTRPTAAELATLMFEALDGSFTPVVWAVVGEDLEAGMGR